MQGPTSVDTKYPSFSNPGVRYRTPTRPCQAKSAMGPTRHTAHRSKVTTGLVRPDRAYTGAPGPIKGSGHPGKGKLILQGCSCLQSGCQQESSTHSRRGKAHPGNAIRMPSSVITWYTVLPNPGVRFRTSTMPYKPRSDRPMGIDDPPCSSGTTGRLSRLESLVPPHVRGNAAGSLKRKSCSDRFARTSAPGVAIPARGQEKLFLV